MLSDARQIICTVEFSGLPESVCLAVASAQGRRGQGTEPLDPQRGLRSVVHKTSHAVASY